MKNPFSIGDTKTFSRVVAPEHFAAFDSGVVHPVLATFWIARDAEWVCRLFVLEMKEEGEEGIGASVTVQHSSPALEGQQVNYRATLTAVEGNKVVCSWQATVEGRLIASGEQVQYILEKARFERTLEKIRRGEK